MGFLFGISYFPEYVAKEESFRVVRKVGRFALFSFLFTCSVYFFFIRTKPTDPYYGMFDIEDVEDPTDGN
jgi:hypothetical protein